MSQRKRLLQQLQARFGDVGGCMEMENPFLAQIAARGSCRHYQSRSVDSSLINTICAVALSSPSKSDLQQRDIVKIESVGQREKIAALFDRQQWFLDAPVLLVVCANNRRQRQLADLRSKAFANDHLDAFFNASVDAGIVLSAMVIAAEAVGLGCCPISILRNHAQEVSDILQLPDYVFPVAGLGLGWPAHEAEISPRLSLAATLHTDVFDDREIETDIDKYDHRRAKQQPYESQRMTEQFGSSDSYGWSEDKARQYTEPQRIDFGAFIKRKKFNLV